MINRDTTEHLREQLEERPQSLRDEEVAELVQWTRTVAGELSSSGELIDDRPEDGRILTNPDVDCPQEILAQQITIEPIYLGFDGKTHIGRIEVNEDRADDVEAAFAIAFATNFPIKKVTPASVYGWDDDILMDGDYSSGFNYRTIAGTDIPSNHAKGRAFDINPRTNPYVTTNVSETGEPTTLPAGSTYETDRPGTLTKDHSIVAFLESRGWHWGGDWTIESDGMIDYQHFDKA